jgi:hypothetical protein
MYSYPEVDIERGVYWNDTIWDTASLVQMPLPSGTLLESNELPPPDGVITDVHVIADPGMAVVEWATSLDASTQLLYQVRSQIESIPLTTVLVYSVHLPLMVLDLDPTLMRKSPPDLDPVREHRVVLTDLPESYSLGFVALSRGRDGAACITSASRFHWVDAAPGDGSQSTTSLPEGE